MAGGSNRPGTGLPAWLVAASASTREAAQEAQARARPDRRVHCWVHATGAELPGLLLQWQRSGDRWLAWVAWTTQGGGLVCAWLDADQVEPA